MLAIFLFTVAALPILILQLGLILGAPWGRMAMGGKFGDVFSPKLRVSAAVQLLIVVISVMVVLARGGVLFDSFFEHSSLAIWCVVALYLVSSVLNLITSSKVERMLGAPTAITMFFSSLTVALS